MSETNNHPASRKCVIKKWDNFDGYGFNLHAEKGKPGQYIGKVDEGSPAEAAGLRQGDRILEVNGEPIANKTHKQVVELIKTQPSETTLVVVDSQEGNNIINTEPTTNEKKTNDVKKQDNGTLNLNMTAAELRAKLAAKKRYDPKKESMDFKQKFDIVQKL